MFDDFRRDESRQRKRFARSIVAAAALYAGASAVLIAASAEARQRVEEVLTQVEFVRPRPPAPPPPPPMAVVQAPAPEPPKPQPQPRKARAKRPPLVAPEHVPTEKPEESDRELAPPAPAAVQEGTLGGVEGGTGTAPAAPAAPAPRPMAPPPPRPKAVAPIAKLIAPVALKTERPRYPARVRRMGIEGAVVVSFDVLDDGKVANPKIVSGPPELYETVLETIVTWRFQPARRGTQSVRHRMQHTIRFRLDDG